jgi:DNA-binding CsgD family transcriptional regulator
MPNLISYEDLHERVAELNKRVLNRTQTERKAVWERVFCEPYIDRLPAGFALFNTDFVLLKCNLVYTDFIRRYTPYTVEQALGMRHFDYKPGSEKFSAPWFRHVRDSGRPETCYDFRLQVLIDGQYVLSYWDVYLSPILDETGRLDGTIMFCSDVTERHALRNTVKEKAERPNNAAVPSLSDTKTALRVLLALREEDKSTMEEQLLTNLEQGLCPWLDRLKRTRLDAEQKACVEMIEQNLMNLTSSSTPNISSRAFRLTPTEMQVAQLVKLGKTSKEIASILAVSKECVDFHRNNLRKKLGLNKQRISLRSHLCSAQA